MTDRHSSHHGRPVLAPALYGLVALAACISCQAASPPPPQAVPAYATVAPAAEVGLELDSPHLIHTPAEPAETEPILRRLVNEGLRLDGDLHTSMAPLRGRSNWARTRLYEVRFTSHQWRGKPVRIFGFYAHPVSHAGRLPALLLVHGGGGYATVDRVLEAASRGYAALSIDLPGGGLQRDGKSRSTGPDMTVRQLFTVKPDLTDNYIYNAVLAQMRSISFLRGRPEVDGDRIGLLGISWGGATGLITTALDKRVACFVNLYGSGYLRGGSTWHSYFDRLPEEEFDAWEANFDASVYVADISVPVLGVTGTNDNCYYLNRFMRTLQAIQPTPDLILRANLDHKVDDVARDGYYKWLAVKLRGEHAASPPALGGWRTAAVDGGAKVGVRGKGAVAVKKAEVWYGEVSNVGWTDRRWRRAPCAPDASGSWWTATIPLPTQVTYAYANVLFVNGAVLSTPVHSLSRVEVDETAYTVDVPFMYGGAILVEARSFGQMTGAEVWDDPDGKQVVLSRLGIETRVDAMPVGRLRFIPMRKAAQRLAGLVTWDRATDRISITLPASIGDQRADAS